MIKDDAHNTFAITQGPSTRDLEALQANQFIERVRGGEAPVAVAQALGVPLDRLAKRRAVREAMEDLLSTYTIPAETRDALVEARMVQVVMEGDPRDAVAAGKVLKGDGPLVSINMSPEIERLGK